MYVVLDKKAPTVKSGLPFNAQISPGAGGVVSLNAWKDTANILHFHHRTQDQELKFTSLSL